MSTLTAAVEATLARRDADELAAAREEQREVIARALCVGDWSCSGEDIAREVRAAPLAATPLGDERIKALEAELAEVRTGRDALEASDECGVDGIPLCHTKAGDDESLWCRMCLVARYRAARAALLLARGTP